MVERTLSGDEVLCHTSHPHQLPTILEYNKDRRGRFPSVYCGLQSSFHSSGHTHSGPRKRILVKDD